MFIITLFYVAWYSYLVFTPQEERPFIVNLKDFFIICQQKQYMIYTEIS
ncbi:MAG: hypothetical protein ACLTDM_07325 [Clostridium butyricum]